MELQAKLIQLAVALSRRGHVEEARQIRMVAHYIPEEGDDVPSFWRKNYDYGEGLYHGDMNEKPGVKEWRKKHRRKGPNFPKKAWLFMEDDLRETAKRAIEEDPERWKDFLESKEI